MTSVDPGQRSLPSAAEPSLGELVSSATRDLSSLVRQEINLAKVELKREAGNAGKGAGMLGGAGFLGLLALIFLSVAAAHALGRLVNLGTGFLIVGVLYLLVAGVLALLGKKSLSKVGPPGKTIETVKDDISWAKHPTAAPARRH
ncbi:MAG: putative integral rane protein [Frankiales bacterium]|nr:putative integral rane protein [Frankiales bacterium]